MGTRIGAVSIILRQGLLEVVFGQDMTRKEVRALLKATSSPVEFRSTGDHGFRIPSFRDGTPTEALRLLKAIERARETAEVSASS